MPRGSLDVLCVMGFSGVALPHLSRPIRDRHVAHSLPRSRPCSGTDAPRRVCRRAHPRPRDGRCAAPRPRDVGQELVARLHRRLGAAGVRPGGRRQADVLRRGAHLHHQAGRGGQGDGRAGAYRRRRRGCGARHARVRARHRHRGVHRRRYGGADVLEVHPRLPVRMLPRGDPGVLRRRGYERRVGRAPQRAVRRLPLAAGALAPVPVRARGGTRADGDPRPPPGPRAGGVRRADRRAGAERVPGGRLHGERGQRHAPAPHRHHADRRGRARGAWAAGERGALGPRPGRGGAPPRRRAARAVQGAGSRGAAVPLHHRGGAAPGLVLPDADLRHPRRQPHGLRRRRQAVRARPGAAPARLLREPGPPTRAATTRAPSSSAARRRRPGFRGA